MQSGFANNQSGAHLAATFQAIYGTPRAVGFLLIVSFLAGLVGPFGTRNGPFDIQPFLYWTLIVFGTALPAKLVFNMVEHRRTGAGWRRLTWAATGALVAAGPIALVVATIGLVFGYRPDPAKLAILYAQCALVVVTIDTAARLIESQLARTGSDTATTSTGRPAIMDRLPGARRGRLIRLSAQDHYVEVVTDRGTALLPMRFRDAITETAPAKGAQVHRSHWVAVDAVTGQRSNHGATRLVLSDGSSIPVGRTFRERARQAGLLV